MTNQGAGRRLLRQMDQCPDDTFLIDGETGRVWSYAAVDETARRFSAWLLDRGVVPGDRVALRLTNSVDFVCWYLASAYVRAVVVPLGLGAGRREQHEQIACASPTIGIYEDFGGSAGNSRTEPFARSEVSRDDAAAAASSLPPLDRDERLRGAEATDIWTMTFTSGTTSRPKPVRHFRDSLIVSAEAFNHRLAFDRETRLVHVFPMTYMAGWLNSVLCPLMAGGSVFLQPSFDARSALRFWEPVREWDANTLWLSPTMAATVLRTDRSSAAQRNELRRVRTACVGTAPLSATLQRDFAEHFGIWLQESYGLSETLFVTANEATARCRGGHVGRPLAGVELRIEPSPHGNGHPAGEGEILVRTPWMMATGPEDLDRGDGSDASWFPTGDLGSLQSDGSLRVTGRLKEIIIRGGTNISPRAVEEVLAAHPLVREVAVVGIPHDVYGEEVTAVIAVEPGSSLGALRPELLASCRRELAGLSIPTRWVELPELPRTASGKIRKAAVSDRLQQADALAAGGVEA